MRLAIDPRNHPIMIHCSSGNIYIYTHTRKRERERGDTMKCHTLCPCGRTEKEKSWWPLFIYCCTLWPGKDRTGIIVALILACCGVDNDTIVENYHESELYLQEVMDEIIVDNRSKGLNERFDGTPKQVMREVLQFIETTWGSVPKFLNNECSFSFVEQHYLKNLLLLPKKTNTRQ